MGHDKIVSTKKYDSRSPENLYGFSTRVTSGAGAEETQELAREIIELSPKIEQLPRGGDSVRTWITFKGKMISTSTNRVIWDRDELYYDPKCEYVEDMQSNPELVVNMLTRAIGDIAVNVVNEIQ